MSAEHLNLNHPDHTVTSIEEIENIPARSVRAAAPSAVETTAEPADDLETRLTKLQQEILTLQSLLESQSELVQRVSDRFMAQDVAEQSRSSDRERDRAHPDRRTKDQKKAEFYADRSRLTYLKVLYYEEKVQKAALAKLEAEAAFRREQDEKKKAAALAESERTGIPSIYDPRAYMNAMVNAPIFTHGCKPVPMGPVGK